MPEQRVRYIAELEESMRDAARKFEFEKAAQLRDRVKALREPVRGAGRTHRDSRGSASVKGRGYRLDIRNQSLKFFRRDDLSRTVHQCPVLNPLVRHTNVEPR